MAIFRKIGVLVAIFAFCGLATSCATLFGDKDRMVQVASEPSGARVFVNGQPYGKTPTSINIADPLDDNFITFKLAGYDDVTRPVLTAIQPIAFLNLLNIICWGIDFATGNVMEIKTKFISVQMDKKGAALSPKAMSISALPPKRNVCAPI